MTDDRGPVDTGAVQQTCDVTDVDAHPRVPNIRRSTRPTEPRRSGSVTVPRWGVISVALAVALVPGGVEATGVVMGWCRGLFRYLVRRRDFGTGEQRGQGDRVPVWCPIFRPWGVFSGRCSFMG